MEPPAAAQCFLPAACEGRGATHLLKWSGGVVPVVCNKKSEQSKTVTFWDPAFWWGWLCYKIISEAFFSFCPHSPELVLH